jgi:hypothetical protein
VETRAPKRRRLRSAPDPTGYTQAASPAPATALWKTPGVPRPPARILMLLPLNPYLSDSTKLLRSVLKSEFAFLSLSTILIE